MRSYLLFGATLGVACCAALSSCQKNYNSANTTPVGSVTELRKNMQELTTSLKTTPQTFTVTAGTPQTVVCNKGTALGFYANSFKDKNGNIITSGSVSVQITEMYTPGDMISNRAGTSSNGRMLQSSGQVNITATANGEKVYANKYSVGFKMQDSAAYHMSLYYGNSNNTDSALNWSLGDASGGTGTSSDGSGADFMYIFDTCTTFDYVNCDRLPDDTTTTHIFLKAPDASYTVDNTEIFLIIPSLHSFVQNRIGEYDNTTHTFKFGDDGSSVPVGLAFKIVLVTYKNGNYYYYEQDSTTTPADMTLNIATTQEPLSYITAKIKAL